jgi:hypothetical protein
MTAPTHTIQSSERPRDSGSRATASGVYVPAMIRKMFEWSSRLSTPVQRGDQLPRW